MVIIFTFVWALDMDCKVMFVRDIILHTVTSRWPLMISVSWNARRREYFRLEERTRTLDVSKVPLTLVTNHGFFSYQYLKY